MGLALLITWVVFAGCLDGGGDDSSPTDTPTGSATSADATGTEGTVPDGVDDVWVCATEPMADYVLTLTPPA